MKALIVILAIVLIVAVFAAAFLFGGWIWMLCLGALSHIFGFTALAISYWQSVVVCIIFWLLFGGFVGAVRNTR